MDVSPVYDVELVTVAPDEARQQAKQWIAGYRHLKSRVQAVTAEMGPSPACEALRGREVSDIHSATAASVQRLQADLWTRVRQAQDVVERVGGILSNVRPDQSQVERLADAIDAADRLLAAVRDQQVAALERLYQEEAQLEATIEAIVTRVDDEMVQEAEAAAQRGADGPPGTSGAPYRAASAGPRRPASRGRAVVRPRSASRGATGGGTSSASASRSASRGRASCPGGGGGGSLAPEVQEYDDFMAEHGPTGGWEPEDHAEFLAILHSCEGDYTRAVGIVHERAIGFTRQDVIAHARWHMDLLDLEARKRMALERWRQQRAEQRAALVAAQAALHSDTADLARHERERDQRSKQEEQLYAQVKKVMVARWRQQQEEQRREAAERARAEAEAREAAKRAEREARLAASKAQLQAVKAKKDQEVRDAERRAAAEAAMRAALSVPTPQQLQRVAERSSATFQRRLSLVATKEAAKGERERVQQQLLQKVHVEAAPDPRRLLRGTAAHMQRVRAQLEEERRPADSGFILHAARRAVPNWRAGL